MDLIEIQAEQIAWSERNFGSQLARLPHLGIIEELGELGTALANDNLDEVLDAVGDVGIYALDFCGRKGWSLHTFWEARAWFPAEQEQAAPNANLRIHLLVKHLAHHQLKGEQGIRGGAAHHEEQMKITLSALMWTLGRLCTNYLETDFLTVIERVWSKVRLRDWTKNKNNAHEVAEQQVINTEAMAKNNDP